MSPTRIYAPKTPQARHKDLTNPSMQDRAAFLTLLNAIDTEMRPPVINK